MDLLLDYFTEMGRTYEWRSGGYTLYDDHEYFSDADERENAGYTYLGSGGGAGSGDSGENSGEERELHVGVVGSEVGFGEKLLRVDDCRIHSRRRTFYTARFPLCSDTLVPYWIERS